MAPFVRVGKYIVKKKIGEGAFAEVRLAAHEETGEEYAVKVFNRSLLPKAEFEREVKKEIRIMQHLRHPNIVAIHAVLVTATKMYLVMELVRGGELYDEIVSHGRIEEDASRKYFQQLVDAMTYCHRRGVVHRDLKPENLLLDGNGNLKVTDFGMSWMKAGQQDPNKVLLSTQCGTPKYMAPEVIMRPPGGYDGRKSDVWEIGMVLYALLAGFLPFTGDDDNAVFRSILNGRVKFPSFFSDGAKEILRLMLDKDPNTRSTLEEVRKHPWFRVNYQGDLTKELSTVMSKMVSEVPPANTNSTNNSPTKQQQKPQQRDESPQKDTRRAAAEPNEAPADENAKNDIDIEDKENVNVNGNGNGNVPDVQAQSKPKRRESVLRAKLRVAQVHIPGIAIPTTPKPAQGVGPSAALSPVSQWRQDVQTDLGEMDKEQIPTLAEEQVTSGHTPNKTPGTTKVMKAFKVKFNFPSPKKKGNGNSAATGSDNSGASPSTSPNGGRVTPENEGRTRAAGGRLGALLSSHHSMSTANDGSGMRVGSAMGDDALDAMDREGESLEPIADRPEEGVPPTSKSYFPSLRLPSLKNFSPMRAMASSLSNSPRSEDEGASVRSIFRGMRLGSAIGMGSGAGRGDRSQDNTGDAGFSSWFSPVTSPDNSPRTIVGDVPGENGDANSDTNNNPNATHLKSKDHMDPSRFRESPSGAHASPNSLSWKTFYRTAFSRGE